MFLWSEIHNLLREKCTFLVTPQTCFFFLFFTNQYSYETGNQLIAVSLWHEAIFARMGWRLSLDGVQSFIMLLSSFISGSCQPLQFPLYLEATYTSASIGLTYTTMKPSPHLGLLITRHSRDFASNIMVILKFSPLQLIRWEINPYRWNYI